MPGVGLALSTIAVVALGFTADALARLSIREDDRNCYVCKNLAPGGTCNENSADFSRECSAGDKASCDFNETDGFISSCSPDSLRAF